jgi:hypothetical protein
MSSRAGGIPSQGPARSDPVVANTIARREATRRQKQSHGCLTLGCEHRPRERLSADQQHAQPPDQVVIPGLQQLGLHSRDLVGDRSRGPSDRLFIPGIGGERL